MEVRLFCGRADLQRSDLFLTISAARSFAFAAGQKDATVNLFNYEEII